MNVIVEPGPLSGELRAPSSKSEAHRLLVCAALACRCDPYAVFLAYVVSSAAAFSPRNSV